MMVHYGSCNLSITHSKIYTFKTHCLVSRLSVGVDVPGYHSHRPSSTLCPFNVYRVAGTLVSQPACLTHIHAVLPCQVQLSSCGQTATQFGTLVSSFVEGELFFRGGEKYPAWVGGQRVGSGLHFAV